jgi:TatD DNase family protein
MLVDIGVNLTNHQFEVDRTAVVERAIEAGVTRMVVIGTSVADSQNALALAHQWPDLLTSTAGIHPHDAKTYNQSSLGELSKLASDKLVVAIGECGLDYNRDFSPRPAQIECFEAQLHLASEARLPVFMHQRDAHDAFLATLKPSRPRLSGGVVHCFTGSKIELDSYLDLDLYIGITGWICDERRGANLREIVRRIPLERVLVETDAPYLLPRDMKPKPKGRRNEPCYLPHIVSVIAQHMGISTDELAEQSARNACNLFGLDGNNQTSMSL